MIREIQVKNFKCFEDLKMNLSHLNVLTGINGMGKSTTIQVLLLLRQAFDNNCLNKKLQLNGNLVNIGHGKDILFRGSDTDEIEIKILFDFGQMEWMYSYNADSPDLQVSSATPEGQFEIGRESLFNKTFSYVSAERLGPQRYYNETTSVHYEDSQIGKNGELFVSYLVKYGNDSIINKKVVHPEAKSDILIYQFQTWLSEISPGLMVNPLSYMDAGLVGINYKIQGEEYTPMNIGFGVSYVAPVILALLKATPGDLIIIENPEAHLHPKGQRKMGELISLAAAGGVQVIVETHSDHLLNGIRLSVKNKSINRNDVSINYYYLDENNQHSKCSPMILDDGELSDWPEGFFDEWDKALGELI